MISTYSIVENDPRVLCSFGTVHLLGLCTGLLLAAAAATADTVQALLDLAPKIISLPLHLSLYAHERLQDIEPSVDGWTMVLSDMNATDAREKLDRFHANNVNIHWHTRKSPVLTMKGMPLHKQAYISAVMNSSVSISGPPLHCNVYRARRYSAKFQ